MIKNSLKKLLVINILICTIFMLVMGSVKAAYNPTKEATITNRSDFKSAPNLGETIGMTWGGEHRLDGALCQTAESDHVYCVQHQVSSQARDLMYVNSYVEITGSDAIGYTLKNPKKDTKNGKKYWNGTTEKKEEKGKKINLKLAYVLHAEDYRKGYQSWESGAHGKYTNGETRRRAIYEVLKNDWYSKVGYPIGLNSSKWNTGGGMGNDRHDWYKSLLKNANDYAEDYNKNCTPTIETANKKVEATSINTVGPFKFKFSGRLDSIKVNGNTDVFSNNKLRISTDKAGKNLVTSIGNIKSNKDYYIQNSTGTAINKITVNLKKNTVITAKIWFLEKYDLQKGQRMIKVETGTKAIGASLEFDVEQVFSNIKITKKDYTTGDTLKGAVFRLYCSTKKGWVTGGADAATRAYNGTCDNNGKFSSNVGKFPINDSGEVLIKNLNPDYKYRIYETKAPDGYDLKDQTFGDGSTHVYVPSKNYVKCTDDIKIASGDTYKIDLNNRTSLRIKKMDYTTKAPLEGVEFRLYCKGKGWVSGNASTKNRNYTSSYDEAGKFVTHSNGETDVIKNLNRNYQYRIYETKAPEGYSLKDQTFGTNYKYVPDKDYVQCTGNFTIGKSSESIKSINLYNKKETDQYVKLHIVKRDAESKTKVPSGATFKLRHKNSFAIAEKNNEGVYELVDWGKENDNEAGTPLEIKDGELDIRIPVDSTNTYYEIWETKAPEGYSIKLATASVNNNIIQLDANKGTNGVDGNKVYFNLKPGSGSGEISTTITIDELRSTKLIFKKLDAESNNALEGAEFKLQHKKQYALATVGSDGEYKVYNWTTSNDISKGTVLKTDANGLIKIEIPVDKDNDYYALHETKAPSGYTTEIKKVDAKTNIEITDKSTPRQNGLKGSNIFFHIIDTTKDAEAWIYDSKGSDKINLSGHVWVDIDNTKSNKLNKLYNSGDGDILVKGVKVMLLRKSDNTMVKDPVYTDENGKYTFTDVDQAELANYYVKFDYTGTAYSKYHVTQFNARDARGSRAMSGGTGIAFTYNGQDSETEKAMGLSGNVFSTFYNTENKILEYINLGLYFIDEEHNGITETLDEIEIKMTNGKTYKFSSNPSLEDIATEDLYQSHPQVRVQDESNIKAYSAWIDPSDIIAMKQNQVQLEVNVRYKIYIPNDTKTNTDTLKEEAMLVKKLSNIYDSNRYKLNDENWKLDGGEGKAILDENSAEGKKIIDTNDYSSNGIKPGESKTTYINFTLTREAIEIILDHPYGVVENFPTKAIATEKHRRWHWQEKREKGEPVLDKDGNPEYTWYLNNFTTPKDEDDTAPYFVFRLSSARNVSGTVFEDEVVTTNGEKLGNGEYDEGEELVEGVKVELIDAKDIKNGKIEEAGVTKLFLKENNTEKYKPAVTTTDENGGYNLEGMLPGEYYLRFRYGDGKYKITYLNTEEVVDEGEALGSQIGEEKINAKEYKSTIISKESGAQNIKNATKSPAGVGLNKWFKNIGANYSVATDIISTREAVNAVAEPEQANVLASTPPMSIPLEYLAANDYGSLNFGIIKQPEQKVSVEKIVTNVKLTNAQNNVIFNGNPAGETPLRGVSDLTIEELKNKLKGAGSTYVRAELTDDIIYGSTMLIKYEIRVTNESDINYYNNDYYFYGDKNPSKEVTLKINKAIDLLDSTMKYIPDDSSEYKITVGNTEVMENEDGEKEEDQNGNDIKATKLTIENWKKSLYTAKLHEEAEKNTESMNIYAQRVLSNTDTDMELINLAKVERESEDKPTPTIRAIDPQDPEKNTKATTEILKIPSLTVPEAEAEAVVTIPAPTGADKQSKELYVIAGIGALTMLATGIVVIKRKML